MKTEATYSGPIRYSQTLHAMHTAGIQCHCTLGPWRLFMVRNGKERAVSIRRAKRIAALAMRGLA